jgi:hypothetical protein
MVLSLLCCLDFIVYNCTMTGLQVITQAQLYIVMQLSERLASVGDDTLRSACKPGSLHQCFYFQIAGTISRRLIVRVKDLDTSIFRCTYRKPKSFFGVNYFRSWGENQLFIGSQRCIGQIRSPGLHAHDARSSTRVVLDHLLE